MLENWSKFLTAEAANMTENNFQNILKHSFYSYRPDIYLNVTNKINVKGS